MGKGDTGRSVYIAGKSGTVKPAGAYSPINIWASDIAQCIIHDI
jgi:hypothetical protein